MLDGFLFIRETRPTEELPSDVTITLGGTVLSVAAGRPWAAQEEAVWGPGFAP